MSRAIATVATGDAPRLLRTLCNHWRHRFEIQRSDPASALIPFGEDRSATFAIDGGALRIVVDAPDAAVLASLRAVIEEHLQRFVREETLVFAWREDATG